MSIRGIKWRAVKALKLFFLLTIVIGSLASFVSPELAQAYHSLAEHDTNVEVDHQEQTPPPTIRTDSTSFRIFMFCISILLIGSAVAIFHLSTRRHDE